MRTTDAPVEINNANTKTVEPMQWRWAVGWSLVVLVIMAVPIIWGELAAPAGGRFVGFLSNITDGTTYLSKMETGRRGDWLFHLTYTNETGGPGAYTFMTYIVLGKLAGLLNLPNLFVFHTTRLLFGFGLLLTCYWYIGKYFDSNRARRLAFLLICFSGGFGWFTIIFTLIGWSPELPPDLWITETLTFTTLFSNPHFPLATMLLFLTLAWCQQGFDGKRGRFGWAGAASLVLGFVHPFLLITLGAVTGVYWLRRTLAKGDWRKADWVGLVMLAGVGIVGLLGPLLTFFGTNADPLLRQFMSQNQTLSLNILLVLSGYGFLLPLAAIGIWLVERRWRGAASNEVLTRWRFVTSWAIVVLILQYLPVNFQRRFNEGWHLPIVLLATLGWVEVGWPWLQSRLNLLRSWRMAAIALVAVTSISSVMYIVGSTGQLYVSASYRDHVYSPFLSAGEVGAFDWLKQNAPEDVTVMTGPVLGNRLPAYTRLRPVWGHAFETLDSRRKDDIIKRFFSDVPDYNANPASQSYQASVIKELKLRYLLYGWRERAEGQLDPSRMNWQLVYDRDGTQIYQLPAN